MGHCSLAMTRRFTLIMTIVFVSVTYYDIVAQLLICFQLLFIVLRAGLVMLLMLMMMTVSMMELRKM